jgi:isoleucyl-tRNA synthetase
MFKPVNLKEDFPSLELKISKYWKDKDIFQRSITERSIDNRYVFYDGPPFITGTPHYGSLLPSIAKDVVPRYQTMKGKRVERVWGWDCHGLPIETKVEKALEIKNRREIEKFGIQRFVDECYKYTRATSAEWKWYVDRIGRWVDFDNSYKTMDQDYIETVLWVFKQLYDKGKVFEGVRTSLYCTRCATPISNFEIAMDNSYTDMEDPAVTVMFPITSESRFKGASILAWTTTPWTVPSNKALVLDPKEDYVLVNVQKLNVELEKAWLINELPANLNKLKRSNITQAYLDDYHDESGLEFKHARIRKMDDKYTFTVKYFAGSKKETGQLIEKTEEISKERYVELIKQASRKVVKIRYYFPLEQGLTAEIDVYQNDLAGLNVVEVEFPSLSKEKSFKEPVWFGKEVTDSQGIYPPLIAGKSMEEINKINENYQQQPHNYEANQITFKVILAKKRMEYILENIDYEVLDTFKGKELLGLSYEPPFNFFKPNAKEHQVYEFEGMVTMDEGTGIVHSAPGFGDIDTQMGKHYGLEIGMSIDEEGKYYDFITPYKGIYVKDADPTITSDLDKMGKLFKQERIVHRFPYCYRCGTPLLQKAQPSWFLDVQGLKPQLLKNNEKINWVPKHLKKGRFKKGIEMAPDWCVSRTRYWASPMPVWQKEENGQVVERVVIGSRDELRERASQKITKLTLLRNGELENSQQFQDKTPNTFLYSAAEKVEELAGKLEFSNNPEVVLSETLGSDAKHQEFVNIQEQLIKEQQVETLGDLDEKTLVDAFKAQISELQNGFSEILSKYEGQEIYMLTHAEIIVFLRHIYEGRSLKESFSLQVKPMYPMLMYFNGVELLDLHRPKIDKITIKGESGELTRVKEVLDVWMDSASMPYASKHYPFEDKKQFEQNFPADFVIEYIAQTRAWFYVMHVLGTALFDSNPFKNVVTTGVIFGTDGRKMSKSYGNYPDPKLILDKYGAEPLRLYLMGAPVMVGEDINLDEEGLKEQVRNFILPLWNCYAFFVTYANIHDWEVKQVDSKHMLDRWLKAQLQQSTKAITKNFDAYDLPAVVREYLVLLENLSKWYIRRSRERFAAGDEGALSTLYTVLLEITRLIAPIAPFISEEIYQNLKQSHDPDSVHLDHFPKVDNESLQEESLLLTQMQNVREIVNLGQSLRAQKGIKVRQVLASIAIKTKDGAKGEAWMDELIKQELNVKDVKWSQQLDEAQGMVVMDSQLLGISVSLDTNLTPQLLEEGLLRELIRLISDLRKKEGLTIGDSIGIEIATNATMVIKVIEHFKEELKQSLYADRIELVTDLTSAKELNLNGHSLKIKLIK